MMQWERGFIKLAMWILAHILSYLCRIFHSSYTYITVKLWNVFGNVLTNYIWLPVNSPIDKEEGYGSTQAAMCVIETQLFHSALCLNYTPFLFSWIKLQEFHLGWPLLLWMSKIQLLKTRGHLLTCLIATQSTLVSVFCPYWQEILMDWVTFIFPKRFKGISFLAEYHTETLLNTHSV